MKYRIPKSWADVTIAQFNEINRLDKSDEMDYLVSSISVLCGLSVENVESLTLSQLRAIGQKMTFLQTMPEKFVNYFKIKGNTYFVDCNIAHISAGQYIDLNKYIEDGADENLHKILTVFCLPTRRTFLGRKPSKYGVGYDINKLADEFYKHATIDAVYPLAVFFCKLLEKSMPAIQASLAKEMESLSKMIAKQVKKNAKHSSNIGDGSQSLTT